MEKNTLSSTVCAQSILSRVRVRLLLHSTRLNAVQLVMAFQRRSDESQLMYEMTSHILFDRPNELDRLLSLESSKLSRRISRLQAWCYHLEFSLPFALNWSESLMIGESGRCTVLHRIFCWPKVFSLCRFHNEIMMRPALVSLALEVAILLIVTSTHP